MEETIFLFNFIFHGHCPQYEKKIIFVREN